MNTETRIRDFRQGDFHRLWEIDQECFPPGISYSQAELLAFVRRPKSFTLVADQVAFPNSQVEGKKQPQGSVTVGFIVAEQGPRQAGHVITIDVLKDARRAGLGSRLLTTAEDRLRDHGGSCVFLETAVDNTAAISFYKRHGYFVVKTVPRYYATGVDAFVLKKDLLCTGLRE